MGRGDRRSQGFSLSLTACLLGGCATTGYLGPGYHLNKSNTCGEVPFLAEVDFTPRDSRGNKGRWSLRANHISHIDKGFPVESHGCDTTQDSIYIIYRIW